MNCGEDPILQEMASICALCNDSGVDYNEVREGWRGRRREMEGWRRKMDGKKERWMGENE